MLTTEGLILATSEATSGVPGKRGGDANGAGVAGTTSFAATGTASAAVGVRAVCAFAVACRWQPAVSATGTRRAKRTRDGRESERICPREQAAPPDHSRTHAL